MDDNWNIRAAKALGCKLHNDNRVVELSPALDAFIGIGEYYLIDKLKFTTSYDWAMLGVKEILNRGDRERAKFEKRLASENFYSFMAATPEQITRAWVTVLEGDNQR